MSALKILITGGGHGKCLSLLQKISNLHAKQSFSFAIITGDFFAHPEDANDDDGDITKLISGEIKIPLFTYFTLGKLPLPEKVIDHLQANDNILCENLEFLGKRTTLKTSDGIRIVALGGGLDRELAVNSSKDKYLPFYSNSDANSLRGAKSADLLITSDWPSGVTSGSIAARTSKDLPQGEESIAQLCSILKPRYHFSSSPDKFFEREPFVHPSDPEESVDGFHITRFLSIASFGNPSKEKWAYAFTLDPKASLPSVVPGGCTSSPFQFLNKKRPAPPNHHFDHSAPDRHHKRKGPKRQKPTADECFFCLGNPDLAAHMVVSIGSDAYLATAKGPLPDTHTYPDLGFPAHILVIPLPHVPRLSAIPAAESERTKTVAEMSAFTDAVLKMLASKSRGKLGAVVWEVSRATGIHTHWQILPVPVDLISSKLVEAAFKKEAANDKMPAVEYTDVPFAEDESSDCLKISIRKPKVEGETKEGETDEKTEINMRLSLPAQFYFDAQFPRRVLAKLLRLDSRKQWQDCVQSEEEETADADGLKAAFADFDIA